MNYQPDWHYFYHPPQEDSLAAAYQSNFSYGDFLLSPYPIDGESSVGGTQISPSRSLRSIPLLVGHVSLLSPDSSHDSTPKDDPRTHYLGEAVKIGMTFVSGYEFRVSKHVTNASTTAHWHSSNQRLLAAAAAEHLLCYSGITANFRNPPAQEKLAHAEALNYITGLLRDVRLLENVRHAFLNAMDILHIAISYVHNNPGLAVSLSVASIEAAADCFFGKDKSRLLKADEREQIEAAARFAKGIKEKCNELLSEDELDLISDLVGNTKTLYKERFYTKRKFLLFCEDFAPYREWDALARHPYFEIPGGNNRIMPQSPFSAAPSQIAESDLRTLLEETYVFRNKYMHCARQPAALTTPSLDTYFETLFDWEDKCRRRAIKPALLIGIARSALVNWLAQSVDFSQPSAQPASLI